MSDRNAAIRALIEHRFPDATPVTHRTAEPVATGIEALDAILPGHGLPRGRLTVWVPQGGATAVLRAACHTTVATGRESSLDRWARHRRGSILGRGPNPRSSAQSEARTSWSRGASPLRRVRARRDRWHRARGHRDGATLPRRARRRWRASHSHVARIDGQSENDLADPARDLSVEKNSLR